MATPRPAILISLLILAEVPLAGCLVVGEDTPALREIRIWVEAQDWPIHPNVTTPVWAFCAEGDGVEPVAGGPCGVPGPTIRVTEGDTIRLTFENTHSVAHTIHFHGWHPFTVDMNGAEIISEAMLVKPGTKATIEWTAEPAGTFIYHCHFQTPTHMDMGMYGAFIVEEPHSARQPDVEYVAVLDEWAVHPEASFVGNIPSYNFFTINGKSFPTTLPWMADVGQRVRIHMVNAGFEFHAMHLHGYTPDSWEGIAGPRHAVPTDVREIAPGQSVVLDFKATREGVWLFHDHVVTRVTAASDGAGFGAYPRGMLTVLVVGRDYANAVAAVAPDLLALAARDAIDPEAAHASHPEGAASGSDGNAPVDGTLDVTMRNFAYGDPELHIQPGTTVTWRNQDPAVHTVTLDDGTLDSGDIAPGASWSHTFTDQGTYTYHCAPHAIEQEGTWKGMVATIIVEESG